MKRLFLLLLCAVLAALIVQSVPPNVNSISVNNRVLLADSGPTLLDEPPPPFPPWPRLMDEPPPPFPPWPKVA